VKTDLFQCPHQLLGGACRDSIRVYSWIGGDRPSDVGKAAKEIVKAGFTAVKMNGTEELQYIDSHEKVRKMAETGHNWKNPIWRHKDGSVAEW
jgi:galactonate dehydratase